MTSPLKGNTFMEETRIVGPAFSWIQRIKVNQKQSLPSKVLPSTQWRQTWGEMAKGSLWAELEPRQSLRFHTQHRGIRALGEKTGLIPAHTPLSLVTWICD